MLKLVKYVVGLILVLSLQPALACSEGEAGCEVDSVDWMADMQHRMPLSFCAEDSPFVKCSEHHQAQCKVIATKAADQCLAEVKKRIPHLLNRAEANDWGATIGDCMGKKLLNEIKIKEDKASSCRDLLKPVPASKAVTPHQAVEKMILKSPKLTRLNNEMRALYQQIEIETMGVDGETGAIINPVSDEQILWENNTRNQCTTVACLEKAYTKRIQEMKKNWKEAL